MCHEHADKKDQIALKSTTVNNAFERIILILKANLNTNLVTLYCERQYTKILSMVKAFRTYFININTDKHEIVYIYTVR